MLPYLIFLWLEWVKNDFTMLSKLIFFLRKSFFGAFVFYCSPSTGSSGSAPESSLAQVEISDMSLTSITAPSPLLFVFYIIQFVPSLGLPVMVCAPAILQIQAKLPAALISFLPRDPHKCSWASPFFSWMVSNQGISRVSLGFLGSNPSVELYHLARHLGINAGQR